MTNVLLVYTNMIPSVRFCALEPLRVLQAQNKIQLRHAESRKITKKDLNFSDVVVFVRGAEYHELEMAKQCKDAGRKLIYVLDDDLLHVPSEISCSAYFRRAVIKANIEKMMDICDVLWTPSPNLIHKYGRKFEFCVLIDEPFIGEKYQKIVINAPIRIGFAGSETHTHFINSFMHPIAKSVKEKYKDAISFEFFGVKPNFLEEIDGRFIPYSNDYASYCDIMRERNWDIGLAPLENSDFAKCKYFNKYIEYASYGIAGVYSAVEPYTFGIRDEQNGLVAENRVENWVSAITRLIEDESLRKEIAEYAGKELEIKFNVQVVAESLVSGTEFLCTHKVEQKIKYNRVKNCLQTKWQMYTELYGKRVVWELTKKAFSKVLKK